MRNVKEGADVERPRPREAAIAEQISTSLRIYELLGNEEDRLKRNDRREKRGLRYNLILRLIPQRNSQSRD
jgi:hypothetical protein